MAMIRFLQQLVADFQALIWPTSCVSCGAPDRNCCEQCIQEMRKLVGKASYIHTPAGAGVWIACEYSGCVQALLVALKHRGSVGFAAELGPLLSEPVAMAMTGSPGQTLPVLLVTVPSRAAKVRERGYRHLDLIVRAMCNYSAQRGTVRSLCVTRNVLKSVAGRQGQVGLHAAERVANAAKIRVSAAGRRIIYDRSVIVVDDIATTGASLVAAARVLVAAGARSVTPVALCGVSRRDAPGEKSP